MMRDPLCHLAAARCIPQAPGIRIGCRSRDVDGITSDRPDLAQAELAKRRKR